MSRCWKCKHYYLEFYDGVDGFSEEWCKVNNIYLHDDNCPNYEKELQE